MNKPSQPQITLSSDTTVVIKVNKGADTAVTVNADKSVTFGGSVGVGTGGALLDVNGNELLKFTATAAAVNEFTVSNAAAEGVLSIVATGSDTDIDVTYTAKGTGMVMLGPTTSAGVKLVGDQPILDSSNNEYLKFVKTSAAVNELTLTNAAAGGAVQLATTGGDTDINLQLVAKGTVGNILIGGYGGVEATAGAATGVSQRGYVTTEALTTAAGGAYTLTLTNPHVTLNSYVTATVEDGTNTQGIPVVGRTKATLAGTATIEIRNLHATEAFNGTLLISYGLF